MLNRSEGIPNTIFHPCALWARGLARYGRDVGAPPSSSSASVGNSDSKYVIFEFYSEIPSSGPSHSIRLVKWVSKNSARAKVNDILGATKTIFLSKIGKSYQIQSNYIKVRQIFGENMFKTWPGCIAIARGSSRKRFQKCFGLKLCPK